MKKKRFINQRQIIEEIRKRKSPLTDVTNYIIRCVNNNVDIVNTIYSFYNPHMFYMKNVCKKIKKSKLKLQDRNDIDVLQTFVCGDIESHADMFINTPSLYRNVLLYLTKKKYNFETEDIATEEWLSTYYCVWMHDYQDDSHGIMSYLKRFDHDEYIDLLPGFNKYDGEHDDSYWTHMMKKENMSTHGYLPYDKRIKRLQCNKYISD